MPPQYVKAYVKRNKNDAADAEAICEAGKRPSMRFVPVKTIEQQSALLMHRVRDLLIRQRTMLVNALRGHMAEFGLIEAQGLHKVAGLIAIVMDNSNERIPDMARQALKMITGQINELQARVAALGDAGSCLAQEQSRQPASGHHPRGSGRSSRLRLQRQLRMQKCSATAQSLLLGSAWCRGRTPPAAKRASVGLASEATVIFVVCSSTVHTPCCFVRRRLRLIPGSNKTARVAWAVMSRQDTYRRAAMPA